MHRTTVHEIGTSPLMNSQLTSRGKNAATRLPIFKSAEQILRLGLDVSPMARPATGLVIGRPDLDLKLV